MCMNLIGYASLLQYVAPCSVVKIEPGSTFLSDNPAFTPSVPAQLSSARTTPAFKTETSIYVNEITAMSGFSCGVKANLCNFFLSSPPLVNFDILICPVDQ